MQLAGRWRWRVRAACLRGRCCSRNITSTTALRFEGALCDLCVSRDIGVVTYYSPASGFLTGKYRQPSDLTQSQRGSRIGKYLNPRGMRIIDTLAAVADEQGAKPAEVAPGVADRPRRVTAPIASATSVAQVESFARAAALEPERGAKWRGWTAPAPEDGASA